MEEVYEKPVIKKSHKKRNVMILSFVALTAITLFIVYNANNPFVSLNRGITIEQPNCQEGMTAWCNDCFSINNKRSDAWGINGKAVGKELAKCSNKYFQTNWTPEQDCTGGAIGYCSQLLGLQTE